MAKRALAFEIEIIAFDPYLTEERAKELDIVKVDLEEAFVQADYLTVHMPLTEETKKIVDASAFSKMKDGVRVFNCARGGIIDEDALAEALKSGKVAYAGLDVYEQSLYFLRITSLETWKISILLHIWVLLPRKPRKVWVLKLQKPLLKYCKVAESEMLSICHPLIQRFGVTSALYLDLCQRLGAFARQAAKGSVKAIHITYFGAIVDFDCVPLDRAVQKGWLMGIVGDDGVNDVNAPFKLKDLGIKIESKKSSDSNDYNELIEVKTICSDLSEQSVRGTLLGKGNDPRIVEVDGQAIEVRPVDTLLVVRNVDKPGLWENWEPCLVIVQSTLPTCL